MIRSPPGVSAGHKPTLDGFVRADSTSASTRKRSNKSTQGDDAKPKKRKSGAESSRSTDLGRPVRRKASASEGGKVKPSSDSPTKKGVKKKKKVTKPFVADNRKLGTVELLDSSDESDASSQSQDLTILSPPPVASTSGVRRQAGKIVLEEEDWVSQADDATEEPAAGEETQGTEAGSAVDDGPQAVANLAEAQSKLAEPAEQDAHDGCSYGDDDDVVLQEPPPSDDDVIVVPNAPSPPVPGTPPEAALKPKPKEAAGSFLAPLSRLFTRASPAERDASGLGRDDPGGEGDAGNGKKPFSVLSSLPNAFTALMAGHAETIQWKAAEKADKQKGRLPKGEERRVPFYKWIDGLEITVDAFRYGKIDGCKAYFLSHAHSDHYQNLSSTWSGGPIYASQTTINLIKLKLGVRDEYLFPLPLDETVKVHGIDVTLIDANHCPGSVLFLFEGPHTDPKSPYSKTPNRIFRYLHCGDFRASPQHIVHPCMSMPAPLSSKPATLQTQLRAPSMSRSSSTASSTSAAGFDPVAAGFTDPLPGRTQKRLDAIYLDTTYLGPSYCFPAQELVISACAELVRERIVKGDEAALWRADGRDAERKGLKGWLAQGGGDIKGEVKDDDEDAAMMELAALPEEYDEDDIAMAVREETPFAGRRGEISTPHRTIHAEAAETEEPDEEAWLAAHEEHLAAEATSDPRERLQAEAVKRDVMAQNVELVAASPLNPSHAVAASTSSELVPPTERQAPGDGGPVPPPENSDGSDAPATARDSSLGEPRSDPNAPLLAPKPEADLQEALSGADEGRRNPSEQAPPIGTESIDVSVKAEDDKGGLAPQTDAVKSEAEEKPDLKPKKERLLVLIGTYSIGKERIVKAIARALSTKVFCDGYKRSLFLAQDDPSLHELLTEDPLEAQVHVGGLRDITRESMQDYLGKYKAPRVENGFTSMIGLRPTGWTYRSESKDKTPSIAKILQIEQRRKFSPAGLYPQRDSTPITMAFGVPYSEHSSFFELTCFCLSLEYTRIIPTVNVHTANSRNKMKQWIDRWAAEKKRRKDAKLPRIVPFRSLNYW